MEELWPHPTPEQARERIYGMPYAEWKARYQQPASASQLERFEGRREG